MGFSLQDLAAALVAVILTGGILALALTDRTIPGELAGPLGFAMGWLFTRSNIAATNGRKNGP